MHIIEFCFYKGYYVVEKNKEKEIAAFFAILYIEFDSYEKEINWIAFTPYITFKTNTTK